MTKMNGLIRLNGSKGVWELKRELRFTYTIGGSGGGNPGEVDLTTSAANVSFGAVTPGMVMMINLSTTATMQWGLTTTNTLTGRIRPKRGNLIEVSTGATLRMRTLTGTGSVEIRGVTT